MGLRAPNLDLERQGFQWIDFWGSKFAFVSVSEHESQLGRPIGKALVLITPKIEPIQNPTPETIPFAKWSQVPSQSYVCLV